MLQGGARLWRSAVDTHRHGRAAIRSQWLRSITTWKASKVDQGGNLRIDASAISNPVDIEVTMKWEEHCELSSVTAGVEGSFKECASSNQLDLVLSDTNASSTPIKINACIPELFNLSIVGNHCNITLKNKLMGDLSINSQAGSLTVDKVKGEHITLETLQGDVVIRKVLEGGVTINCNKLQAKMINGDSVHLTTTSDVHIGAMYGKQTSVFTHGKIEIGLFKGTLEARSQSGGITVKSIDGAFDLEADNGNIEVQINKLHSNENSTDFENNVNLFSSAMAKNGSVKCLVDPEIRSALICESADDSEDNIDISSDAFELETLDEEAHRIEGKLTGVSKAVKRPRFESSSSSGKIDLSGAENSQSRGNDRIEFVLQLLAKGKISVETMSWIDVIRRKHGFLNEDEGTLPPGYQRRS